MKTCTRCGQGKPLEEFARTAASPSGRRSWCLECMRKKARDYYASHREERKKRARKYFAANRERENERRRQRYAANRTAELQQSKQRAQELRQVVLGHYGRACSCCGSAERLVVDHVNGDGRAHRLSISGRENCTTPEFYRWLIQNGFPERFQILCQRCNSSKQGSTICRLDHGGMVQIMTAGGSVISLKQR